MDSELAGLGFAFEPVRLELAPVAARQPARARRRSHEQLPAGGGGGGGGKGGALALPDAASNVKVAFNLKQRGPGPAYSSPRPPPQQQQPISRPTSVSSRAANAAAAPVAGLAALKLASLQRRATAQADGRADATAAAALDRQQALERRAAAAPAPVHTPSTDEKKDAQQEHDSALLHGLESRLAGCASRVLQEPPPEVELPEHVLLGLPVLAVPSQQPGDAALGDVAAADSRIAAYRPVASSIPATAAAEPEVATAPAAAAVEAAVESKPAAAAASSDSTAAEGMAVEEPASGVSTQPLPETLEEALECLGLLPSAEQQGAPGSSGCAPRPPSQPQWVRLRAVLVVAAAKEASAAAELAPLVRRLRQARMHLEFHQANVVRGRARSPRSSGTPSGSPGPWLSGRSSAVASKHRTSRSGSPGQLQPRPKVVCPTPEASDLQVQLLGSLCQKLLLKLGLAALRQAVASAALRRRLLEHAASQGAADLSHSVLLEWHSAAVPSQQQEEAAAGLARKLLLQRQRAQLVEWGQWATHRAWQHRQLECGQQQLRRRLLTAAMHHWRCYCQAQLVQRLQAALAARWAAAWGHRRLFVAWRQAARRSAALKSRLLGRSGSSAGAAGVVPTHQQEQQQPPTQAEALAATAAAFQPVKAFVAEATQQLAQLQRGLLRWGPAVSSSTAGPAEGKGEQADSDVEQREPAPLGSFESLLAELQLPKQPQLQHRDAAPIAAVAVMREAGPAAATAAAAALERAQQQPCEAPVAAAPEPSSPPPNYNPASYASPAWNGARQQQPWPRRRAAAEVPAAVEAEVLECQGRVEHLRQQLAALEQESEELQLQCSQLEGAVAAAQQAAGQLREACSAAAAAKDNAAEAMQSAAQQHAAAAAECGQHERQLQQQQRESQNAVAAEAGARAAAHAAAEQHAVAAMDVQRWSKTVEGIARELAACHRTQQAPVALRLKEARQRLEQHQQENLAAQQQLPQLQAATKAAVHRAAAAQKAVLEVQQCLVASAEHRARLKQQLDAAMEQHEAAAVAAVAAKQQASAAEQQHRLLSAQQQAAVGRLRQMAQQVLSKQQQAVQLANQVQTLQVRHRDAVATMLAAEQQQQRRGKLKRQLQVVQEQGDGAGALPSPTAVQQRHPPPATAAAGEYSFRLGSPAQPVAAEPSTTELEPDGQLVLQAPQVWEDWPCSSSELSSSQPEAAAPSPPLTVDEAADRFYTHCLLRHALHTLRQEAACSRSAMQAAAGRWRQRQLVAVVQAWRVHAAEAADWLYAAGTALRRRWLLRQWQTVVAERRWHCEAEAAAHAFARRKLLVASLEAWRQHVRHEYWRDAAHEAVVQLRLRDMLRGWRAWARQRQQNAARQRAALAIYKRRLLGAALRQWRWVQHSKALLHRVFSTAVELWQEEVGVRLHQHNFERVQACWDAWQLAVLQAQAQRRQAILWNAAVAFREKQLLGTGLQAFRQAVADARDERRQARLSARVFGSWRRLAATSARHYEYEAARQQRRDHIARMALAAWRASAEATAGQLATFWLRWQVQATLRQALRGWHTAAAAQRSERELAGMADCHRERQLLQQGLEAFAGNAAQADRQQQSPNHTATQPQVWQQQQQLPSRLAPQHPQQQQQQQQQSRGRPVPQQPPQLVQHQQPLLTRTRTTIIISHGRGSSAGQEQQPPAPAVSGSSCAAAQSMLTAVSDWRAAADYWRQRHGTFAAQQQQQSVQPLQQAAAVGPQTAATLLELRAQWQQR